MNNIEKYRAFIDSLEGEKGLPNGIHGWRFNMSFNQLRSLQVPDPVYDIKTGKQVVGYSEAEQFRTLCEPEKDSKEVRP